MTGAIGVSVGGHGGRHDTTGINTNIVTIIPRVVVVTIT